MRFRLALGTDQLPVAFDINLRPARLAFKLRRFADGRYFAGRAGGVNFHLGIRRAIAA